MKFVDPKNDVAFNKIFGNIQKKEILISFLNAVLELKGDREISDVKRLDPLQTPKMESFKYTLLDVKAKDKQGITFIVEMQIFRFSIVDFRFSIFNTKHSLPNTPSQIPINSIVFIGILDFLAFNSEHYLTQHLILNKSTNNKEFKNFYFNFIELPKFNKSVYSVKSRLEKWIYFLKHANELNVVPKNADFLALKTAYELADPFRWNREELEFYDYWDMKVQDELGAIQTALEEGRQQGEQRGRLATARAMLADGLEPATIIKYTGLSSTDIATLSNKVS